ncbi:MAG: helix-turn-helix transcriptional regulator [Clostridia bacterium]|nr:helix-turn-helix transcriptional regulator [Clostridia bacterium]
MVQNISGEVKFSPLFIHSFQLLAPHHLLESEKFNIRFSDPSQITEIADKLRWYRYRKALLQREIAELIGIDRSTYIRYEEYGHDYYPIEHMKKLADLYGVPVTELLDEFNLFLYNDQGKQIREIRNRLGLSRKEYAKIIGVHPGSLKKWELNTVRIFKSTWERYFRSYIDNKPSA